MRVEALIFDVDGTLAETEEVHRIAFEQAFAEDGLDWRWDVELYRDLLRVTGGKERIRHFVATSDVAPIGEERVVRLHLRKNEIYGELVRAGGAQPRPGVRALIERARAAGLRLALATTTSRTNVEALIEGSFATLGPNPFAPVVAGEDVAVKKPDPEAYVQALVRLGLPAAACLVFEDSWNGLRAATGAGLRTIVTPSLYTAHEDFTGAAAVVADLDAFDLTAW